MSPTPEGGRQALMGGSYRKFSLYRNQIVSCQRFFSLVLGEHCLSVAALGQL